ncbi:MAG: alpha/beta fold hydrolase [Polyangiaceae bacterium]|nr:alpha/beta fold hydrolase [Polyangiaceae bacterium]
MTDPRRFTPSSPRIAYYRAGESGPAVLLVMGYGMRGAAWEPQVDTLRRDHRLCYYDHLGVGESDDAPGPITMKTMARDALRVMDAAGFERAHLVGVSMGGMIAQELALHCPERFDTLTLVATHAGGLRSMLPTPRGLSYFARAQVGAPRERVKALTGLLYPESYVASIDKATLEARMRGTVGVRAKRRTLLYQLRAIALHDARARLGAITLPTLVVRPGLDVLIHPSHSDELHRRIPGSTLVRIDDAGHGCLFQSAETLADVLRSHFRGG